MAMDSGAASAPLENAESTVEPAFGLPAYWITESQKSEAEIMNYTVVEASAVLATHLTEVVRAHAGELLSRQSVKELLENLKLKSPAVVEEVVPTHHQARRASEGHAEPAPRACAGARSGNDSRNARRLRGTHQGSRRAYRIRPQRAGANDLQTVCRLRTRRCGASRSIRRWKTLITGHIQRSDSGGGVNITMPAKHPAADC